MHRTLKESTVNPPGRDIEEQQETFEAFQYEYNFEHPHEALGQKTPASFYLPSLRPYPVEIPKIEYAHNVVVRQVRHNGEIKWKGNLIYILEALAGEPVALKQKRKHLWEIRFSFYPLGVLNELVG